MPSLTYQELLINSPIKTEIFVETGTFEGDTVYNMLNYFDKIYSVELSHELVYRAKSRFSNNRNVTIIQGDSSVVLAELCKNIDKPTFFWLDGHFSQGITAQGEKDVPLVEELTNIVNYFKNECVIAIDDVRLFNTYITEDWTHISKQRVLELVKNRLVYCNYFPSSICPDDRMVLHLKSL